MKEAWYSKQVRSRSGMNANIISTSIPGVFAIEATINFLGSPIGVVWYRWVGKQTIELLQSYVHHQLRRLGVRTWLHEQLLTRNTDCKRFITAGATKDSKPWLKKIGFTQDEFATWVFVIDKKRKSLNIKTT